ncbi:23S rRNA (adenine(1618)-N(6))-methyltransferase RlmF [Alkalimarinus coralli]|uniref:23S rRNA (adenine(1618)-N(6))-methyltransferase RlmF n=1 Tax=Alkalimarinus coralli TaxID=2935863 RepID=UPI00202ACE11|nr:23S rRNA (adenine(1618)-N(6))-methyltransferase RlmF [Alkalimarinus coralli]
MKANRGSNLKANKSQGKGSLHPRNIHRGRYDLERLCQACPELKAHIKPNPKGDNTIDFSDQKAVLSLNRALLAYYYKVTHWQIPDGYLCPPIPGRADYIHYVADLLEQSAPLHHIDTTKGDRPKNGVVSGKTIAQSGKTGVSSGKGIKVLDIGTGANCIYPIIGSQSYGWHFTATDIDPVSVAAATCIVESNRCLKDKVTVKLQKDPQSIFKGIITANDRFALTLCNPPFHSSMADATAGSRRKWKNLNKTSKNDAQNSTEPALNFGGQKAELWCKGGEIAFLTRMVKESVGYGHQVGWFTSLVSKRENVKPLKAMLRKSGAKQVKVVEMAQGQKISRLIAWTFHV